MRSVDSMRTSAAHFTLARRTVLAVMVVSLTLAGHTAGSSSLPSLVGVLLTVVLASGLTLAATAQQRSWYWLMAFLLASQLLIHVVLVLASPHEHDGGSVVPLLPTGPTALGHLAASAIAAVVLARGEQTLSSWARLLSSSLDWLLPAYVEPSAVPTVRATHSQWTPIPAESRGYVDRRGPPQRIAA